MGAIGGSPPVVGTTVPSLTLPNGTLSAGKLPFLHRALANVLAGSLFGGSDRTVLFVGDSHMYGATSLLNTASPAFMFAVMRGLFNAYGVNSQAGFVVPPPLFSPVQDNRFALGVAGWAPTGVAGIGLGGNGNGAMTSTTLSSTFTYTPGVTTNLDTFDVYYAIGSGAGTFTFNVDGGANNTVNTSGGSRSIGKSTITAAASSAHVLNFNVTAAGFGCTICGIDQRLSTTPTLRLGNAGVNAAHSTSWTNATAFPGNGPLDVISAYAPDVSVICVGGNDVIVTQTPVSTYLANMTTLINRCKLSGDVVLVGLVPQSPAQFGANVNTQLQTLDLALKGLANSLGVPLIDAWNAWGGVAGFNTLFALGGYYDGIGAEFVTSAGYGDRARMFFEALVTL
jgi:hypothetical protein